MIYLIGCGNLGSNLGLALKKAGYSFSGVYSRTQQRAENIAKLLECDRLDDLYNIPLNTDIIILALPDNVLLEMSAKFDAKQRLIIHTSGSVEMEVLKSASSNYGVFYPLQSFSFNREVSFDALPVFLEASNDDSLNVLITMSAKLNAQSNFISSDKRKVLHLAAVFACNFSNFMILNAEKILENNNLNKEWLHPLVTETFKKAIDNGALNAQTGPAIRGDKRIIDKHLDMLNQDGVAKAIYEIISGSIFKTFK